MVTDPNDIYKMMMTMTMMMKIMIIMMVKTQNGHNLANFGAKISRFFMVIDLNDTYRMMIMNGHN